MDFSNFWHMDVGHVSTVLIFAVTFLIGKAMDRQKKDDKVDEHDRWIREHKKEDEKRDEILGKVQDNLTRLTTLQESTEYRLRNLETDAREVRRQ